MIRRNITLLLLILSLAGNACFTGGYLYTHRKAAAMTQTGKLVETVIRELKLDTGQQQLFKELKQRTIHLKQSYRRQMLARRAEPKGIAVLFCHLAPVLC